PFFWSMAGLITNIPAQQTVQVAEDTQTKRAIIDGFDTTDFPFLNFFKSSSLGNYPDLLNSDYYPRNIKSLPTSILCSVSVPSNYTGPWVLGWFGEGQLNVEPSKGTWTVISKNVPGSSGTGRGFMGGGGKNGRFVFTTSEPQASFAIRLPQSVSYNNMH